MHNLFDPLAARSAQEKKLIDQMSWDWCTVVRMQHPVLSNSYVEGLCEDIVNRARIIAMQSPTDPLKIASFLLSRTRAWILAGFPPAKIAERLPKDVNELGTFVIRENLHPMTGAKMTGRELEEANLKGALNIQ